MAWAYVFMMQNPITVKKKNDDCGLDIWLNLSCLLWTLWIQSYIVMTVSFPDCTILLQRLYHQLQKLFCQPGSKTWWILCFPWITDLKISQNTLYTSSLNNVGHRMVYTGQSTCKNVLCHLLAAKNLYCYQLLHFESMLIITFLVPVIVFINCSHLCFSVPKYMNLDTCSITCIESHLVNKDEG
jgi:hypothetical protein